MTSDMDGVRTKLSEKRKTMNEAKSKVDEVKARLRKRKAVRTLTEFCNIYVEHITTSVIRPLTPKRIEIGRGAATNLPVLAWH